MWSPFLGDREKWLSGGRLQPTFRALLKEDKFDLSARLKLTSTGPLLKKNTSRIGNGLGLQLQCNKLKSKVQGNIAEFIAEGRGDKKKKWEEVRGRIERREFY